MKLRYVQFRDWCFTFMGENGNEGFTSDALVSQYQNYKKERGIKTVKGVPSINSASEVLKRDRRFKKGDSMSKTWKDDMIWITPRIIWFLNSDNE